MAIPDVQIDLDLPVLTNAVAHSYVQVNSDRFYLKVTVTTSSGEERGFQLKFDHEADAAEIQPVVDRLINFLENPPPSAVNTPPLVQEQD